MLDDETLDTGVASPRITDAHTYIALPVSFTASGDNTLITAMAGKVIRVYSCALTFPDPVDVTFMNGAVSMGEYSQITSIVLDPFVFSPRFVLSANTAFIINLSAALLGTGTIWYTRK